MVKTKEGEKFYLNKEGNLRQKNLISLIMTRKVRRINCENAKKKIGFKFFVYFFRRISNNILIIKAERVREMFFPRSRGGHFLVRFDLGLELNRTEINRFSRIQTKYKLNFKTEPK